MTEAALLRAVADDPHDVLTRSAYADWLEEQGDARAAFLRLQLALPSMPLGTPDNTRAQQRLRELRRGCTEDWLRLVEPLTLLGELSVRAGKTLQGRGVTTLSELHGMTWGEVLWRKAFGETSRRELAEKLAGLGLSLVDGRGGE